MATTVQLLMYIVIIVRPGGQERKNTYVSDSVHKKPRRSIRISHRH